MLAGCFCPSQGCGLLVEVGCCRVVVGPFSQWIQVAWTSSLSKGGSAGRLVIRGCLGPWEPVLDSHRGGQYLVELTAFHLWSCRFSPHVGRPSLSCLDEYADVTEMYGLRSSVLLGAADGTVVLVPSLSASGGQILRLPTLFIKYVCDKDTYRNTDSQSLTHIHTHTTSERWDPNADTVGDGTEF